MLIKRGDIYYADLSPVKGSEQGGVRPVIIIQNDTGNKYSPTVICAAVTAQLQKNRLPTHISINSDEEPLERDSIILLEQIKTIDKNLLHIPSGNSIDNIWGVSDRNLPTLNSLQRLLSHGRLANTGDMKANCILLRKAELLTKMIKHMHLL